jgi:hypothetical protein
MSEDLRGLPIVYQGANTILIPLPPEFWRPIEDGCQCTYCLAHPDTTPYWDTLALAQKPRAGSRGEHTYMVHHPESHRIMYPQAQRRYPNPAPRGRGARR